MESPSREKQYILNRGSSLIADHFRNKIIDNFVGGRVAVLVKNLGEMLYFLPCNENGYPDYSQFRGMEMLGLLPYLGKEEDLFLLPPQETNFIEYTIVLKSPLIMAKLPDLDDFYGYKTIVFLWEGEIMDRKQIRLEDLDVKHLMRLAQEAVKKREGIIIDLVEKNRLIK